MPKTRRDDTLFTPAGDLRHSVTVSINSTTGATFGTRGEVSYSSTTSFAAKAKIETLGGSEGLFVRQMFATASHRVTLRYDSRIDTKARLTLGSDTLHILAADNVQERDRELILICGREV